jgi:hypothetical protein
MERRRRSRPPAASRTVTGLLQNADPFVAVALLAYWGHACFRPESAKMPSRESRSACIADVRIVSTDLSQKGQWAKKYKEGTMRILTLTLAGVLAVGFAASASAATKKKPAPTVGNFEQCEQLAIERGVPHGQTGHAAFVAQCMGKRPPSRQL